MVRIDDISLNGEKACASEREHQRLDQGTTFAGIHASIAADGVERNAILLVIAGTVPPVHREDVDFDVRAGEAPE